MRAEKRKAGGRVVPPRRRTGAGRITDDARDALRAGRRRGEERGRSPEVVRKGAAEFLKVAPSARGECSFGNGRRSRNEQCILEHYRRRLQKSCVSGFGGSGCAVHSLSRRTCYFLDQDEQPSVLPP